MDLDRLSRGQLVLSAATVIVVAVVAVLFASLQLGYHPDLQDSNVDWDTTNATLDRTVHAVAAETAGDYSWRQRAQMADTVSSRVDERIAPLETKDLDSDVVREVGVATDRADAIGSDRCPSGSGRRFGSCVAIDGVVLQERAGEAVVLAVAFEIDIAGPDHRGSGQLVVTVGS